MTYTNKRGLANAAKPLCVYARGGNRTHDLHLRYGVAVHLLGLQQKKDPQLSAGLFLSQILTKPLNSFAQSSHPSA